MSKYCKFPWTWTNVKVQNDKWRFCCKVPYVDHDIFVKQLEEVKDAFINDRSQDLDICNACWIPESKGYKSYRTAQGGATSKEQIINFYHKSPSVEWIDIEFGDTCNMYCLICGPSNSSLWQQMINVRPNSNDKFDVSWEKLTELITNNIQTLDHLNLYGGEPSVDSNFYKVVDHLLSYTPPRPIGVQIYTNGNYSDNHRIKFESAITNLTNKGWKVELNFSLDAIGDDVEFIRGGLVFKRFEKNLITMIDKGYKPFINVTLSVLNIANHVEIYKWLLEKGIADKVIPKFNSVSNPKEFNVSILGNKINNFVSLYPETLITNDWQNFKNRVVNFLNIDSSAEPNKDAIEKCISKIENLAVLSKSEIPDYYKDLIKNLRDL